MRAESRSTCVDHAGGRFCVKKLVLLLIVTALAGVPLVAYLWETLNALLSGHVDTRRLAVSAPVLVLFIALLALLGRLLGRIDAASRQTPEPGAGRDN
jgi:hypothetical protein